jgi:hypothetical protein
LTAIAEVMIKNFPSKFILPDFFISYVMTPSKNTFSHTHLKKLVFIYTVSTYAPRNLIRFLPIS